MRGDSRPNRYTTTKSQAIKSLVVHLKTKSVNSIEASGNHQYTVNVEEGSEEGSESGLPEVP